MSCKKPDRQDQQAVKDQLIKECKPDELGGHEDPGYQRIDPDNENGGRKQPEVYGRAGYRIRRELPALVKQPDHRFGKHEKETGDGDEQEQEQFAGCHKRRVDPLFIFFRDEFIQFDTTHPGYLGGDDGMWNGGDIVPLRD